MSSSNAMLRASLAAALLVSVLNACASSSESNGSPPLSAPQSWSIVAGGSSQSEAVQALDFYPNALTIHAGDTVTWSNGTSIPHTVSIPQPGQSPPGGPPNPAPVGGGTYDGSTYVSSGFITNGKSYAVTFTKPGTYAYYCIVHLPEMAGTIVVLPSTAPLPQSAAAAQAAGAADQQSDLDAGAASFSLFPYAVGGTHLAAGISPGLPGSKPSQATVMRFLDDTTATSTITIPLGTTVTWTNEANNAPHTVTFPALGQQPPAGPPDQVPPAGGSTYDGSALANSGVMPPGKSYTLTFTKTGTYTYYCLFHDGPTGMIGTVVVQ
ncbi:MAG: hypothetical protein KGN02_15295 [bacterium]|nr:hypothetical protein [bacterium]